jgi:uncharacterized membrane protein YkvA (DUF1232 family)
MSRRKRTLAEQVTKVEQVAADLESHPNKIDAIMSAFPAKLTEYSGKIPFLQQLFAVYYAIKDSRTPLKAKATLAAALAYFIVPADLIPDVIAGFGFTDDLAVLTLVLKQLSTAVTAEHYELARRRLQSDEQAPE